MELQDEEKDGAKVDLNRIVKAKQRISSFVHFTPVFTNQTLDKIVAEDGPPEIEIFCKSEFLQKTGSFKVRGSLNSVLALKERESSFDADNRSRGVVTESSGNNGAALAWAASVAGYPSVVVMTPGSSDYKKTLIGSYGAEIEMTPEATTTARKDAVKRVVETRNFAAIYDDDELIAGQGTMGLELLEQVPDLDAVLVPASSGGMLAGVAIAVKSLKPEVRVYAVEPKGKNTEASMRKGRRMWKNECNLMDTIGDGFRMPCLGRRTWPIIRRNIEKEVFEVSDAELIAAMKFVYQRMKFAVEVTGAAGVAAVTSPRFKELAKNLGLKKVALILCGGNADLEKLPWIEGAS